MLKKAFLLATVLITSFIVILLSLNSCQNKSSKPIDNLSLVKQNFQEGYMLTQKYCNSCHLAVAPEFLDKETWLKHVLPAMAPRLGIAVYGEDQYVNNPNTKSSISYEDWLKIINYYQVKAPIKLPLAKPPVPLIHDWSIFSLKKPLSKSGTIATTTMVSIDDNNTIFTSDATTNNINRWNQKLTSKIFTHLPSPATCINYLNKNQNVFTCIGEMRALDVSEGQILSFSKKTYSTKPDTIAAGLPRPIHTAVADFNKDSLPDYVVCSFGHNIGGLYWLKQKVNHQFEKRIIRNVPGATQAIVGDYNKDGWPDIMCLFAQAQEGIWLFLNDQHGGFKTQNLIRFLPVFGSSSFQVADFNHDGQLDLLYTCGDNSDYSKILKPFHGMYIYLNQGNFKFKKSYFYPIDGCTKAIPVDFDGDGDLDIATIAFFSDFQNNSSEGFIYFEQDKMMHFLPHAIPVEHLGRWICMDANDLNHDGKPDIVLGNFSLGFNNIEGFKPGWDLNMPFILLENKSKKY